MPLPVLYRIDSLIREHHNYSFFWVTLHILLPRLSFVMKVLCCSHFQGVLSRSVVCKEGSSLAGSQGTSVGFPTSSPCLLSYWQGSWNSLFQDTTSAIYQNSANMWVCSWILFCFKVFFVYSVTLATSSQWHLRGQVTLPVFFPPLKKISAILEPFLINFHKKNSQLGFCFELLETYFKIWGKLTYLLRFCLYMVFLSIYFGLL